MVNMFRICATARLFIHEMLPSVDAGIYLDSDVLLMDNISNLWSFFKQFNSAQVMGLAAVEFSYSTNFDIPHFGPPGVGLNAGVILMNLTRMRDMSGGGFTGTVRCRFMKLQAYLFLSPSCPGGCTLYTMGIYTWLIRTF